MRQDCNNLADGASTAGRILAMLGDGTAWHSGEDMAARLGVSRAAVAKHVAALRRQGHVIPSVTNRGYRLAVRHEPLQQEAVQGLLKTRRLGRGEWRILQETASTNTEAITWALADAREGSVVAAERQTRGKGRKGREWFSSPRGLYVSLVLRPGADDADGDAVTLAATEALREAIHGVAGLSPETKLPNDLLLLGRKIAGVLVESGSRAGEPDWMAVGVGVNVNALQEEFPPPLRRKVTSLLAVSGRSVSRNRLLAEFLNLFEKRLRAAMR